MFSPLFISTTNKKFFTPLVVAVHHAKHVFFWIGVIIAFTEQAQPWHRYGMWGLILLPSSSQKPPNNGCFSFVIPLQFHLLIPHTHILQVALAENRTNPVGNPNYQ